MLLRALSTSENENIIVSDFFLFVCQSEEILIYLVELFSFHLYAIDMQAVLQGCTSGTRRQYDRCFIYAYLLRIHDLIGGSILQHSILMYAR